MKRPGHVYLFRGLWGIWSLGMDRLADRLRAQGYDARVLAQEDTEAVVRFLTFSKTRLKDPQPVILIGHSGGGNAAIQTATELARRGVATDLLVILDTVAPEPLPAAVLRVYNLYQSTHLVQGGPLEEPKGFAGRLTNLDVNRPPHVLPQGRTDHFSIDDRADVHERILALLEETIGRSAPERRLAASPRPLR